MNEFMNKQYFKEFMTEVQFAPGPVRYQLPREIMNKVRNAIDTPTKLEIIEDWAFLKRNKNDTAKALVKDVFTYRH
jgi:hypothetical protein